VIAAAFAGYPRLDRVRARADPRNRASIRVMEKLGMTLEGRERREHAGRPDLGDEVLYGVRRREWRS